ncbi:hypothetical protein ACXYX3_14245 [Mycobacterium sp. C3-094]
MEAKVESTTRSGSEPPPERQMHEALSRTMETAARIHRIATATRAELKEQLGADEVRALADADAELEKLITRTLARLEEEQNAAEKWQEKFSVAIQHWIDQPV